jgi:uracil-DNA glycosylase
VYIANVIKCRPPHNRNPEPAEVAQCRPYLQRQIELVQPDLILALGRFAAQTLLAGVVPDVDKLPLGKLRGQVYRVDGRPVVVSYHPAYLLRSPAENLGRPVPGHGSPGAQPVAPGCTNVIF